jgi:hypothetical protein
VTKQLDQHNSGGGHVEKSQPRNIATNTSANSGQETGMKLSRRESRHGSTSSSVNSYEESPADWEHGGKLSACCCLKK